MIALMTKNPELVQQFKDIVNALGGPEKQKWASVARTLTQSSNIEVKNPISLRRIYEAISIPKEYLQKEELKHLINSLIDSKFNGMQGHKLFNEKHGYNYSRERYKERLNQGLKNGMKVFIQSFTKRKRAHVRLISRFSLSTFIALLQITNSPPDEELKEIQYHAQLLKEMYQLYAENNGLTRPLMFNKLQSLSNRKTFETTLQYVYFLFELKQLFLNKQTEQYFIINHPFLLPTIEQNKQSKIYKKFVNKNDWADKYKLYNSVPIDEEMQKLYLKLSKKNKKQQFEVQQEQFKYTMPPQTIQEIPQNKKEVKKFRGRLYLPGDPFFKGRQTVIFDQEEEVQRIEKKQIRQQKKRNQMQMLYEKAFLNDSDDISSNSK